MDKIFPLYLFPEQFFPDISLHEIRLSTSELVISVSDSVWAIEPKIVFFYGPGDMIFTYGGKAAVQWRSSPKSEWTRDNAVEHIRQITDLDMIVYNNDGWKFSFRSHEKGYRVEVILPEVTHITWSGEGEDLEEE